MVSKKILMLFPFAPNKFKRFYDVCQKNNWHITATVAKGQRFNHEEFKCDFIEFPMIEENVDVVYAKVQGHGPFNAVIPFSEFSVVLAERLSSKFGLIYNNALDAKAYRWKNIMRKMLGDAGCNQPSILAEIGPQSEVSDTLLSSLPYPVIVKPADAAGSLNVRICNNAEEVTTSIQQIRGFTVWDDVKMEFSGLALIEIFAEGQEYSTEAIVQNGEIVFQNDTFKFVSLPPFRDEVGHLLPAPMSKAVKANVRDMLQRIIAGSHFANGVIHAEYKVNNDIPYVIEVAYRIPGDRIADLIELHYGVSLEDALIRVRMGEPALRNEIKASKRKFTGVKFQFPSYNSLKKTNNVDFVVQAEKWVSLSELPTARNATSLPNRVGFSVLQSDNFDDLKACIDQSVTIRNIQASDTWALRHQVLRPHQSLKDCEYPNDHDSNTIHLGAYLDGLLVGVSSAFKEGRASGNDQDSYRIRGMAVSPSLQSKGIGSLLLRSLQDEVKLKGTKKIWCNARTTASEFYANHGFVRIGAEFDLAGLGPHYLLEWSIA